jgi:glycosyltransferase involved in cell wall biosynthesis
MKDYKGVRLVYLPAVRNKYAETLSHTALSAIHSLPRRYDIVYICNSANAPLCIIPWLAGRRVVLNVDGLEWRRAKWGKLAKRYYRWATRLAARLPVEVVTDAKVIRRYYLERFERETNLFPYGTELFERGHLQDRLAKFGLKPDGYILYVSRMEPENNALMVVRAYREVETDTPLVMVGDAPYNQAYVGQVKEAADSRVLFLGFRFGDDYHALQANAKMYVQATEVGGTHPALVEAMGHGNAVLAHDVPEHREVLDDAGGYFAFHDQRDLTRQLSGLLEDSAAIEAFRFRAYARTREQYSWQSVADQYEAFLRRLVAR